MFDNYIGQTFDGRYDIKRVIGVGGMAVVFEAYDNVMKRTVAVKMLKDEISHDTQSVKRFINESKAVAMLSHPNIVKIYDVSVKENRKYIVMERVDGITLKSYLNKKGALSMRETLQFTEQILMALEHAHSKGVIHRDIKPQNILLLKNGVIKVTDFGIAKLPNTETVTMTDKAIGTVYYISPEQASGKKVDTRTDIYSLGVLMYEMVTGKLPFNADSPVSVALMHVKDQPKKPSEIVPNIPKGLEQIILAAMEKRPDKRIQSASQMLRLIDRVKRNPDMVFKTKKEPGEITQLDMSLKKSKTTSRARVRTSMFPIIAGVTCAFLIVAVITMVYMVQQLLVESSDNTPIIVDDYVGKTYSDELVSSITSKGFTIDSDSVHFIYSNDYAENEIIDQSPKALSSRKPGCKIELTVSRGAKTFVLEDYSGQMQSDVVNLLRNEYGLVIDDAETASNRQYDANVPSDCIISTEPGAGATVKTGDKIKLIVSKGPVLSKITIGQYVGMTREEAEKAIKDCKFKNVVFEEEYSDTVDAGKVMEQNEPASTEVYAETTTLILKISKGPEKPPATENKK